MHTSTRNLQIYTRAMLSIYVFACFFKKKFIPSMTYEIMNCNIYINDKNNLSIWWRAVILNLLKCLTYLTSLLVVIAETFNSIRVNWPRNATELGRWKNRNEMHAVKLPRRRLVKHIPPVCSNLETYIIYPRTALYRT